MIGDDIQGRDNSTEIGSGLAVPLSHRVSKLHTPTRDSLKIAFSDQETGDAESNDRESADVSIRLLYSYQEL